MGKPGGPCPPHTDDTWTGMTIHGEFHTTNDMSEELDYGTSADSDIAVGLKPVGGT